MAKKRRVLSAKFKSKVALEAIKGLKPLSVLSSEYGVQSTQISLWKKQLNEGIQEVFEKKRGRPKENLGQVEQKLYEEIGRLKMELDWLKKKTI